MNATPLPVSTPAKRLAAYLLDKVAFLLLVFVLIFVSIALCTAMGANPGVVLELLSYNGSKVVVHGLLWTLFLVACESWWSASVGKRLTKCRVVNHAGQRISWKQALGRNVASLVNWMTLGLGFLTIVFRKDRRGLHDILAGTYVVHSDPSDTRMTKWGWLVMGLLTLMMAAPMLGRLA